MLKREDLSCGGGGGGGNSWARVCDTCRSAACTVYCKADSAYLCSGCDARVHAANHLTSRHERVWVCQACERAPAAFLCKADAASLCVTCDAEIHEANPLARRHHRVPISGGGVVTAAEEDEDEEEDEAASWLLLNPMKSSDGNNNNSSNHQNSNGNGFGLFGGEVDEYLDLMEYGNENHHHHHQVNDHHHQMNNQSSVVPHLKNGGYGDDSVVPAVQINNNGGDDDQGKNHHHHHHQNHHHLQHQQQQFQGFQLGLDFESSKSGYNCYSGSVGQSLSISSMDISVVPDSSNNMSVANIPRTPKGTIDLFSGTAVQVAPQLSPMDREARVLRYREKKKTRKFEKTIRYASRKAYAETRPRIKGRFAKRTEVDVEVDQMFSTTLATDSGYGIVPSF